MLDPVEQGAHVLPDQARPDRADRGRIVAGEFEAGPVGERAVPGRDRLGEDRLAGGQREAFEIVADRDAARLAGLGREAEIPFGVILHPRGHVDDHGAGEARGGGAGKDVPEDGRAERPADADRALEVQRLGQLGDVGRHPLDARRRAAAAAEAPWPRRSIVMIRMVPASSAWASKKPPCAISPCSSTSGVPLPVSR